MELERIRRGDLYAALRAVEAATATVTDTLRGIAGHSRSVRILRVQELLAELQSHWREIQQEFLARQMSMLGGIREALHRLRGVELTSQMIDRVTVEVCRSCGVDRCVLLTVEEGKLLPESVHFERGAVAQDEWEFYARAHPPVVDPRDPETRLLRRGTPILVADPATSRGVRDVAEMAQSVGYVAAPVIVRGKIVATLHADVSPPGVVGPLTRDVLATFAEGFSYAMERTVLLERTRAQIRQVRELMARADLEFEELIDGAVMLKRDEGGEVTTVSRSPALPLESRLQGLLTRRELEVIELMARGASNAEIATDLVISEGTVKSHVKHILRKMRAANRAQAVSCYMRLQAVGKN